MTKRELLLKVCENPGFKIPDESSTLRAAEELRAEGWVEDVGGLGDSLTATPRALDAYPQFAEQADIAESVQAPTSTPDAVAVEAVNVLDEESVVTFVANILEAVPVGRVCECLVTPPRPGLLLDLAREIVEGLRR